MELDTALENWTLPQELSYYKAVLSILYLVYFMIGGFPCLGHFLTLFDQKPNFGSATT